MKTKTLKNLTGWAMVAALTVAGLTLAVVILGEAGNDTPITTTAMIKATAILLAYAEYKAARWAYRKGLIPAKFIELINMFNTEKTECHD